MSSSDVWVETYRPKRFDEIVGQPLVINKIKQNIHTKNITNMILSGPNGTGKTTTALAIARAIFGGQLIGNFKEINASEKDKRNVDFVSKDIIPYLRNRPLTCNAPFRILLLEEADNLTKDAQKALRRPFEKHNRNCRVIMTVNYPDRIIPAIQSRFTTYEFTQIEKGSLVRRLRNIAEREGISFTERQYEKIAEKSGGDMRKGINYLQNMQLDTSDFSGVF